MHVSDFIMHYDQYMIFCIKNVIWLKSNDFSETACFAIDVINPYNFSAPSGT